MPHTYTCPRCGHPSSPGNTFCPGCGSSLSSASSWGGMGWKLFFGAFALFVGVVWAAAIYTRTQPPAQFTAPPQPQSLISSGAGSSPGVTQVTTPATPGPALTSAQHLAEAKRALADGYKPNKDAQKAKWGEIAAARWHLRSIDSAAAEHREAQELLKEVARRERQIELAKKKAEEDEDSGETADAGASADESKESPSPASSSPAYSSPAGSTAARQSPPASSSSSDYYTNSRGARVRKPTFSESGPPAGATAQCRDGSYSFSQSRRGTCSHHGGVARWL